jgi:hypothetical protein
MQFLDVFYMKLHMKLQNKINTDIINKQTSSGTPLYKNIKFSQIAHFQQLSHYMLLYLYMPMIFNVMNWHSSHFKFGDDNGSFQAAVNRPHSVK